MNDILAGPITIKSTDFKILKDSVNDKFAGLEPIINFYKNQNVRIILIIL